MGKKKPETIRTSITVTRDLKRQMDAARGVNWSHVAREAFRAKLAEIAASQEEVEMSDVLKRLRESKRAKEAQGDQAYAEGFAAGRDWATHRAEAHELESMYRHYVDAGRTFEDARSREGGHPWGFGGEFFTTILHDLAGGDEAVDYCDFMDRIQVKLGDAPHTLEDDIRYCIAFAEGAVAVWEEVKDQL